MDAKTLGIALGGLAAVAGFSYLAREKSESEAEIERYKSRVRRSGMDAVGDAMNSLMYSIKNRHIGYYGKSKAQDMLGLVQDKARFIDGYRSAKIGDAMKTFMGAGMNDSWSKDDEKRLSKVLYDRAIAGDRPAIVALVEINRGSAPQAGQLLHETYELMDKYSGNDEDFASDYREVRDALASWDDYLNRNTERSGGDPFADAALAFDKKFFDNRYRQYIGSSDRFVYGMPDMDDVSMYEP